MKVKVGDIYGKWKVLQVGVKNPESKAKNPVNMAYCECQCEKKTKRYVEYRALYEGRSTCCGCNKSELIAKGNKARSSVKVGNIYGYLEVIEDLGFRHQTRGRNESWYRCKCHNCGNEKYETNGNNLQAGNTTSCGCINSRGEKLISQILKRNNINFTTQYTFKDLRSEKGYCLKFDFAIFKDNKLDYLIEFDGRQHYEGPDAKWSLSDSLEEIQQRDRLKNDYCLKNGIKLKRIPYYDIGKITIEKIESNEYNI